jgi:hypothetical protein
VAARCPRLGCICRINGFVAKPTLKLLITSPLDSRAPVASALTVRVSRPLVSNHTLRGSGFSSPLLGPGGGYTSSVGTRSLNDYSRGSGRALQARLFRQHNRARGGRRGGWT